MRTMAEFWKRVEETDSCWNWLGFKKAGYGTIVMCGRRWPAHRLAYIECIGPIPEGKQLDHLCRNRACVNPAHLEPVTQKENILRGMSITGVNSRKTHCKNGHPFNLENTDVNIYGRHCRVCDRARAKIKNVYRHQRYPEYPRKKR